jgi:hypothetical protein
LVIDSTASVTELSAGLQVSAFPNPSSTQWEISGDWKNENAEIQLTDAFGRLVYQKEQQLLSGEQLPIPAASLNSGLYFLKLVLEDGKNLLLRLEKN